MSNTIYGVDLNQEVKPEQVRDAMVECFYSAQKGDPNLISGLMLSREECEAMVKKAFSGGGGDFNNPTKESIMAALQQLKSFAGRFRDPEIIEAHAREVMKLVEML